MILNEVRRTVTTDTNGDYKVEMELEGYGKSDELRCLNNLDPVKIDTCEGCCEAEIEHLPTPRFGGAFYTEFGEFLYIERVIYNKAKRTVAVLWNDGVCTKATCDEKDEWNPELGLVLAVMKKMSSNDFVQSLLKDWAVQGAENVVRSLKDVRRDQKNKDKVVVEEVGEVPSRKRGRPRKVETEDYKA